MDILWGWYDLSNCGHGKLVRNSPVKGGNVEGYNLMSLKSKQPETSVGLLQGTLVGLESGLRGESARCRLARRPARQLHLL